MLTLRVFVIEHLHGAGDVLRYAIRRFLSEIADSHSIYLRSFELDLIPTDAEGYFDIIGITEENLDQAARLHLALCYTRIPRGEIDRHFETVFYRRRENILMSQGDLSINVASRLAERVNNQWGKRPVRPVFHGNARAS